MRDTEPEDRICETEEETNLGEARDAKKTAKQAWCEAQTAWKKAVAANKEAKKLRREETKRVQDWLKTGNHQRPI